MNTNDSIWGDPGQFPAVTQINRDHIERMGQQAAVRLITDGYVNVTLEPGDSTRYEIAIVSSSFGAPFKVASSFGALYPWTGNTMVHPDYAQEHYVTNGNYWTATVISVFLNSVGAVLQRQIEAEDD